MSTLAGLKRSFSVSAFNQAATGSRGDRLEAWLAAYLAFGSFGGVSSASIVPNCQRTPNHAKRSAAKIAVARMTRPFALRAAMLIKGSAIILAKKFADGVDDVFLLLGLKFWIDRKRQ